MSRFGKKLEVDSASLLLKSMAAVPTSPKTTTLTPIAAIRDAQRSTSITAPTRTPPPTAIHCGLAHSRSMALASPSCSTKFCAATKPKSLPTRGAFFVVGKGFPRVGNVESLAGETSVDVTPRLGCSGQRACLFGFQGSDRCHHCLLAVS